jgi:peptidoglycan-N-acetylglucosamine deacetylase
MALPVRHSAVLSVVVLLSCARSGTVGLPAATPAPATLPPIEVAVTVDDLPVHGPSLPDVSHATIAERLLAAFRRHRMPPVYGFVNGKRVTDDPATEAILRLWAKAGNPLGNHTHSHVSLNAADLPAYRADIEAGEEILRRIEPREAIWKVFRYPFLFEGETVEKRDAVRGYLRDRGYVIAHVSIDADDWAFNRPFARCAARGDTASLKRLRAEFVTAHVEELRRMRELGRLLTGGREVRQVLLLHAGIADADAAEELLAAYEREGVRFVELATALADPFYALDAGPPLRAGSAFPYRVARARQVTFGPPIHARGLEERLAATCPE